MNLEKLKDSARKFEQKEDWRKAIEVYLKAIQQIESGAESTPDLSLYNRVGDLYLKINDTAAAVHSYERAVDLYADQGFFNNAIALCGKILRVNPGRVQTYLKLAQLHARKNVVIEAKRNLIEFLERMNGLGQLDQAFQSVKEFADQFSGSQEIRMMLVELLRAASREDEALEQLAKIASDLEPPGTARPGPQAGEGGAEAAPTPRPTPRPGRSDLVFLDTGLDLRGSAGAASAPPAPARAPDVPLLVEAPPPEGLEPTQASADADQPERQSEPLAGLEQTSHEGGPPLEMVGDMEGLESGSGNVQVSGLEILEPGSVAEPAGSDDLLDADDLDLSLAASDVVLEDAPQPTDDLDLDLVEDNPTASSTADEASAGTAVAGLPLIEAVSAPTAPSDDDAELAKLEERVADDPDSPDAHRELADRLLLAGELDRAGEELRLSLQGYESAEDWASASAIVERLVALEPDAIHHHQKRVELAFRSGERTPLLEAYLALGDALARMRATDKALAVYRRVQEHDPANPRAAHAIEQIVGAPTAPPRAAIPLGSPAPPASRPPAGRPVAPVAPPATAAASAPSEPPVDEPQATEVAGAASPSDDSFVDLGSMILDESMPRDTRMRVDRREPQGDDEQREFAEILEQFKRGIDENLDTDDYQAHYDLGVAFKEMGLLDEAIAEFQKALRAPEGRLRTSEALGTAFFEKGQFAVSEAVLRRAVDGVAGGDEAKIGLIYWLGRSLEAQGKAPDAITSYERAMAVDIRFMDLSDRIHRLTAGRRE
ncbi:MAG: tetratricopeptide repeat protein [Gemmatimonadales bacterium]